MPILLNKKNIQGLPVAERVNYDFVKATTPWLKGMSCAIRVSKTFLSHIDTFAKKNNTLLFDEILYPTLSLHNNLTIINPIELSSIVYRCDFNNTDKINNYFYWNYNDIRSDYLFHPIKNLQLQNELRKKF